MTVALLVGFAVLVAGTAGRLLPGAGWVYRAPRLGLAAWYAVLAALVGSVVLAVASPVVARPGTRAAVCGWWLWSVQALAGAHGGIPRLAGWVLVAALMAGLGRLVVAGLQAALAVRARRRAHAAALRLLGRDRPDLGVRVVDGDTPAAWLLPGRHGGVVVTDAALAQLPPAQLAAVLAHEHAHAAGRHHLLTGAVGLLATLAPALSVLDQAAAQVRRLVEIRADEVAAAHTGRVDVARAIAACAPSRPAPVPTGTLAATGGHTLERVNRLLTPPPPLHPTVVAAVVAGLGLLVAAPGLLLAVASLTPVVGTCLALTC